ncbi:MAG: N-acetyltransferase family protein [Pseudomonadota bacterium]
MIRPAEASDAEAIAAHWSALIRDTAVTFNTIEKSPGDVAALLLEKAEENLPFFVAIAEGEVMGFASYGQFRAGFGYANTMEHSIMLDRRAQGLGLGRALMAALEDHARGRDVHTLWAGVSGENPEGVRFHRHMGFTELATLPEVGFKFGRWMDLVLLYKRL